MLTVTCSHFSSQVLRFEGETRWSVKDIDSAAEIERERREKAMIAKGYEAALRGSTSSLALAKQEADAKAKEEAAVTSSSSTIAEAAPVAQTQPSHSNHHKKKNKH